jgi:hypothetical protein
MAIGLEHMRATDQSSCTTGARISRCGLTRAIVFGCGLI